MEIIQREFGYIDGKLINEYTLVNDQGVKVTCINYGCTITKIMTPDRNGEYENIVLGYESLEEYINGSSYFGCVVGRVAGRIGGAAFGLDGKVYSLTKNENDNHLHGGEKGFHSTVWEAEIISEGVRFTYISPDGEEGYPGNVTVQVTYMLNNDNEFSILYEGRSDQTTLLNMTNHSYFNLSGNVQRDILDHTLTLKSDQFLELNDELLPTGKLLDVGQTPFDFREGKKIQSGTESEQPQNELAGKGYDHPFLLNTNHDEEIVLADFTSGRTVIVETDKPSVVVYTGNHLPASLKYCGICLETQGLPNAIHHSQFPSIVLEKNKEYSSRTTYKIGRV